MLMESCTTYQRQFSSIRTETDRNEEVDLRGEMTQDGQYQDNIWNVKINLNDKRSLTMERVKCECGHVNPIGTILCESCGRALTEEAKKEKIHDMRYDGSARQITNI